MKVYLSHINEGGISFRFETEPEGTTTVNDDL
jgi:hypothetical protein